MRLFGYESLAMDTTDPHQTQFPATYQLHSAVYSKVLKYDDIYKGIISPDLAAAMPEMPDDLTYIIRLRPGIRFHDTPELRARFPGTAGRELTGEDVVYSISRQTAAARYGSPRAPLYYRGGQWDTVDSIRATGPRTIEIRTKRPTAPFLHFLADTQAYIIPRELVDSSRDELTGLDRMVGTGPFVLDRLQPLMSARFVRNPAWFAANDDPSGVGLGRPFLDGYEVFWPPPDNETQAMAFRARWVDGVVLTDSQQLRALADELGLSPALAPGVGAVSTRLLSRDSERAKGVFADYRLRRAIHLALDRRRLGDLWLPGQWYVAAPVPLPLERWALPRAEVERYPGYRLDSRGRDDDLREARALWEAAGGPSLGPVSFVASGIPEYLRVTLPAFQQMAREALGLELRTELDPTGFVGQAQGFAERSIQMSLEFENGWADLDDWTYAFYHTEGSRNSALFSDPDLDAMLEDQRAEFDPEARRQKGLDIQRYILDHGLSVIHWVSPISAGVRWPYLRNVVDTPSFGNNFHYADIWLDSEDSSFQGRLP